MCRLPLPSLKKILVLFFITPFFAGAQMASSYIHQRISDSIVLYFNSERYSQIYDMTTAEFKSEIKENDLVNLFENGLFKIYGKIQVKKELRSDTNYYVYLLDFKDTQVQLNLGVNMQKQIMYLQLQPYHELSLAKRTNYFSDNQKLTPLDSLVDDQLSAFMQSPQNCGISVGVSFNGKNYYYNYGEMKRNSKQAVNQTTLFEIGSLTKTFCGILLAHAVLEGKIRLEDEVHSFLPGKKTNLMMKKTPVLIKHLANHTSGLHSIPDDIKNQPGFDSLNPYKSYSREMLYDYLKTTTLDSEPGLVCTYSNLGMALLGIILEEVYGKSFDQLVQEKICIPNHMTFTHIKLSSEQEFNFSTGYNSQGLETPHWNLGTFAAAGGIKSNTADMLNYLNYNLDEKDEVTKLAHKITYSNKQKLALAWFITPTKFRNTLVWHNGGTYGFRSFCGFIKEKNCSVVVLGNSAMDVDYIGIAILNYLQYERR